MKAEIKIPKGYRQLKPGTKIEVGEDLWFNYFDMIWSKSCIPGKVGMNYDGRTIFIRKIKNESA